MKTFEAYIHQYDANEDYLDDSYYFDEPDDPRETRRFFGFLKSLFGGGGDDAGYVDDDGVPEPEPETSGFFGFIKDVVGQGKKAFNSMAQTGYQVASAGLKTVRDIADSFG